MSDQSRTLSSRRRRQQLWASVDRLTRSVAAAAPESPRLSAAVATDSTPAYSQQSSGRRMPPMDLALDLSWTEDSDAGRGNTGAVTAKLAQMQRPDADAAAVTVTNCASASPAAGIADSARANDDNTAGRESVLGKRADRESGFSDRRSAEHVRGAPVPPATKRLAVSEAVTDSAAPSVGPLAPTTVAVHGTSRCMPASVSRSAPPAPTAADVPPKAPPPLLPPPPSVEAVRRDVSEHTVYRGTRTFAGCRILLLRHNLGQVQLRILNQRIPALGGTLVGRLEDEPTHVIASLPDLEAVQNALRVSSLPGLLLVVHVDWVSACLEKELRVPLDSYSLRTRSPAELRRDALGLTCAVAAASATTRRKRLSPSRGVSDEEGEPASPKRLSLEKEKDPVPRGASIAVADTRDIHAAVARHGSAASNTAHSGAVPMLPRTSSLVAGESHSGERAAVATATAAAPAAAAATASLRAEAETEGTAAPVSVRPPSPLRDRQQRHLPAATIRWLRSNPFLVLKSGANAFDDWAEGEDEEEEMVAEEEEQQEEEGAEATASSGDDAPATAEERRGRGTAAAEPSHFGWSERPAFSPLPAGAAEESPIIPLPSQTQPAEPSPGRAAAPPPLLPELAFPPAARAAGAGDFVRPADRPPSSPGPPPALPAAHSPRESPLSPTSAADPATRAFRLAQRLRAAERTPPVRGGVDSGRPSPAESPDHGVPMVAGSRLQQRRAYVDRHREAFVCQQPAPAAAAPHPNQAVISGLEKLSEMYQQLGDQWRAKAYSTAARALQRAKQPVRSGAEAARMFGIGPKIAEKIQEILDSGTCQRLERLTQNERVQTLRLFTRIWGVGLTTASRWFAKGYRTLDDLRRTQELTHNQLVGLKYLEELEQRMPREEAAQIEALVRAEAHKIQPGLQVNAVGSYRRGAATCGDVDILITHPDGRSHAGVFGPLLARLHDTGLLTDDLTVSDKNDMYMGICQLKGCPHRRIDIKVYPMHEYAFALLYFTGSDYFNRSMRLFAHRKGYSLSDRALRPVIRDRHQQVVHEGPPVPCSTEQDIFDALGLVYKAPHERSI